MQIVPEIESPGHSTAALNVYPQFSCTGKIDPIFPFFSGPMITKDIFCAGNPESYKFFSDVIKEVAALFPSPYLHLGGDEVPKERWKKCPKCQAVMSTHHIKDEQKLESYFISKLWNEVLKYKKKPVAWDDILEGEGISKECVMRHWALSGNRYKSSKRWIRCGDVSSIKLIF